MSLRHVLIDRWTKSKSRSDEQLLYLHSQWPFHAQYCRQQRSYHHDSARCIDKSRTDSKMNVSPESALAQVERCFRKWRLLAVVGIVGSLLTAVTVARVFQQDHSLGFSLYQSSNPRESTNTVLDQWKRQLGCYTDNNSNNNNKETSLEVCETKLQLLVEQQQANDNVLRGVQQAARYYAQAEDPYPHIQLIREHTALMPLLPQYQPDPSWHSHAAMADLNVVGMAKAGTSQLYKILTDLHPDTRPLHPTEKEFCMLGAMHVMWELQPVTRTITNIKAHVQHNLYHWHANLAALLLAGANKSDTTTSGSSSSSSSSSGSKPIQTVNGCVNWHDLWLHLHYIQPPQARYFVLIRDPADWLWATWNFWMDAALDARQDGNEKEWANADRHYRSPELFHELILGDTKTMSGASLLIGLKQSTVVYGRRLVALAGREKVLFLRNEDLLPDRIDAKGGALDQISDFAGLDRSRFRQDGLHSFTNCNDVKGLTATCGGGNSGGDHVNRTTTRRGAYEIAGNRTMLEATRKFIYLKFWEECKIWSNEFGIHYPDCAKIMDPPL